MPRTIRLLLRIGFVFTLLLPVTLIKARNYVNAQLPWHDSVLDSQGKLLAWYRPDKNQGYDKVLHLGWDFIEHKVPDDQRTGTGLKIYLINAVFDGKTLQGMNWQHGPAMVFGSFVDSLAGWYPYSGDEEAICAVRGMLDHILAHGTTPTDWNWASVAKETRSRSGGGGSKRSTDLRGVSAVFSRPPARFFVRSAPHRGSMDRMSRSRRPVLYGRYLFVANSETSNSRGPPLRWAVPREYQSLTLMAPSTRWTQDFSMQAATITSGVGEAQTGADFGDEGGRGKEKCRRNRSEKRRFRALGFSGDIKLTPSVVPGSTQHRKLD